MATESALDTPHLGDGSIQASSPFLRLPASVRLRIYRCVMIPGFPGSDRRFINLGGAAQTKRSYRRLFVWTSALLLTCRLINDELNSWVYSKNHFFIHYSQHQSLQALRNLRPQSVRSLRWLTVHLNVVSCGLGENCVSARDPWARVDQQSRQDGVLHGTDPRTKAVLEEWHRTWTEHVRPNLDVPSRLRLSFICDSGDYETAQAAVKPFLNEAAPLVLQECSVRLARRPDPQLRNLAKATIASITRSENTTTPLPDNPQTSIFPFMSLPAELRHQILAYTDLVTPFHEVEWNPQHGMYFRRHFYLSRTRQTPEAAHGQIGASQAVRRCLQLQRTPAWMPSYHGCSGETELVGCHCQAAHSAASSHIVCACWAPPTALMLTSRALRQDALRVFYGLNRFVVVPNGGRTHGTSGRASAADAARSQQRLSIAAFLARLPPDALRHLRSLEVVFGAFPRDAAEAADKLCASGSVQAADWAQTLDTMKDSCTLPQLTLSVWFAAWLCPTYMHDDIDPPAQRRGEDVERVKAAYLRVLAPLRALRGLRRFFAHLGDPAVWELDDPAKFIPRLEDLERQAEAAVMGPEYDARAAGKEEWPESRWFGAEVRHELLADY